MPVLKRVASSFFSRIFNLQVGITAAALALCCPLTAFALVNINFDQFWQAVEKHSGKVDSGRRAALSALFSDAASLPETEQLKRVNHYFSENVTYQTDDVVWKQSDYWASPAEFLAKRVGDCEDYAIAKYIFLLNLGVADEKLRLIYVKAKIGGRRSTVTQAHMVLGYYATPDSQPLILDSLISEVLPARQRTDLMPVFSFNSTGVWAPGQKKSSGSASAKLSRWRGLLNKISTEGITVK